MAAHAGSSTPAKRVNARDFMLDLTPRRATARVTFILF